MFKKKPQETLPVLDNIELRKLNTKKIVGTIEEAGKFLKAGKYGVWVYIIYIFIAIVFFMSIFYYLFWAIGYNIMKSEGDKFELLFGNPTYGQRYLCHASEDNATFTEPKQALEFKELFPNATCKFYSIKK